jgi:acyl-CoA dehydrogenase
MKRTLPMTATHLARIQVGGAEVMALEAANF